MRARRKEGHRKRHPRVMKLLRARYGSPLMLEQIAARRKEDPSLSLTQTIAEMARDIRFIKQLTRLVQHDGRTL